ncbi:competence type IV pilus minor pilin ComGG [Salibacterium qingdaonense]|uniref:ComG operon protein 7 n=1 Tax=Salibacterium qingdaonense TaxID=266892 RepID=A0A1I4JMG1_9BACI|nr:competence type IV pilus minor pilin ComGG [Salibacterium qingdaonense]SFL67730.1 ComG operon protein 7 [Salibacterium qingdaonense]
MGEKGAVMPILLIICFLFTSLLFVEAAVFVNEKQSVSKEEQVLQLEWLLRNAEWKWTNEKERRAGNENQIYRFPSGYVQWQEKEFSDTHIHLIFKAVTADGHERTRSYYLEYHKEETE